MRQAEVHENYNKEEVRLHFPTLMDGDHLNQFRDHLLSAFENSENISIDLENFDQLNTRAIQFFVSLSKFASKQGKSFSLKNCSVCFHRAFEDLGLTAELEEWSMS